MGSQELEGFFMCTLKTDQTTQLRLCGTISLFYRFWSALFNNMWIASRQNQQNDCAPSEDSDQTET